MNVRTKQLLNRFFNNQYSRNDYLLLREMLLKKDPEIEMQMQLHWDDFRKGEISHKKDLSALLAIPDQKVEEQHKQPIFKKMYQPFSRLAAILVFPLLLALGFLYFEFNQYLFQKDVFVRIESPSGSRTSLNLPDGSTVWLNGGSYISYPAVFNENRKVTIQGEAFLKVKSDQKHPFWVETNGISVKATGTEFNVLAYDDEPEVSVILKDGKVVVLDKNRSPLKEMEAGYRLKYHTSTLETDYTRINAEDYAGWIDGKLIFRNSPFTEVISRMERWYGVDIEIVDKELLKLHFRATFIDENVEEALKLLQSTATFNYRFTKRLPREDGSFDIPKILITKN